MSAARAAARVGPAGFWFLVLGVFVGFWDTVLSDQDGFGRMVAARARRRLGSRSNHQVA